MPASIIITDLKEIERIMNMGEINPDLVEESKKEAKINIEKMIK